MSELLSTRPPVISCLRFIIASIALLLMTSCASERTFKVDKHLGLYTLSEKSCSVPDGAFDPCDSTLFFELVKGKFLGYADDETVMVFWTGNPEADHELQYTAQGIESSHVFDFGGNRLWLEKSSETEEYLEFAEGQLTRYFLQINPDNEVGPRTIEYRLEPVSRNNAMRVQMNYPESP